MRRAIFTICLLAVALTGVWVGADSIWQRRSTRSAFLWEDNFARRVGDILTIRVSEITEIDAEDELQLQKQTALSQNFSFQGTIGDNSANASDAVTHNSNRDFQGESEFESDREFTDRITVTVKDTLPNGLLVVEGYRRRMIAHELRTIHVSGIVDPDTIEIGNFVNSENVANFEIKYLGKGRETSFTRQGWLGRMVNRLWPY